MDYIKDFHSLPSLYFFILFSTGISIAWACGNLLSFTYLIVFYVFVFIAIFFFYKKNKLFFCICLFLVMLSGIIRMWLALYAFNPDEIQMFDNDYDAFQGKVIEADYRELKSNVYILACDTLFIAEKSVPASGLIVISQGKHSQEFYYGDIIKIYGKAHFPVIPSNPGEFNYRRYLQLNNRFFYFRLEKETKVRRIFSGKGSRLQSSFFNPIRNYLRKTVDKYLSKKSGAIVKALILGERGNLDKGIVADFQKTGVIHVLAISGLHVGFIALMLQFALSLLHFPRKAAIALIILFLLFFVALVNFKAPVVRASLMMSFYYLSRFINRPQKPLNVIALAGIIILIVQPEQLLLPGFQYSFTAVFGLIYGSDRLSSLFPYVRVIKKIDPFINKNIRTPFVGSLAAVLATLPLTWYYFSCFQVGAIIANIFIIPYIAVVLFISILFVCFSWLPLFPAFGIASVLDILIDFMITIIGKFSLLPYVQIITGHPNFFYLILAVFSVFFIFNLKKIRARFGIMTIAAISILLFLNNLTANNKLVAIFINVGQGDAALIQFPNKKVALIDAGDKGFGFDAGQRYVDPVLKYYGVRKIDYLIASHPHSDHIGGFEYILGNYHVDTLIINDFQMDSKLFKRILRLAGQKKVVLKKVASGDMINTDVQSRMYVLHPTDLFEKDTYKSGEKINNSSLVIKVLYGKNSILFSGDAEKDAEMAMSRFNVFLDCDLLKVGHHGSKTSSSDLFLDLAQPEYAVISVGKNNKFKHPSPVTLMKYALRNIPVYRTDIYGAVVFESDGQKLTRLNWR